jgi:hypothetical protein
LNSCSVLGLEARRAFRTDISLFKDVICSSFSVIRSIVRFTMSCASNSAAFAPSRTSSLDMNLVYTDSSARFK